MSESEYQTCVECTSNVPVLQSLEEVGYPLNEKLGTGAYGSVETYMTNNGKVAVKTMRPPYITSNTELQPDVIREISTLVALSPHPDIIGIFGFVVSKGFPAVVLELGMLSLKDALKDRLLGGIETFEAKSVLFQILRGTAYMNTQDIWHRDIKPANVIITQFRPHIKVKLADFGLARSGPWCGVSHTEVMYTLWYRSPEILIGEYFEGMLPQYNESAEMWAVGIVMWEIITATLGQNPKELLRASKDDTATQLSKLINGIGHKRFLYKDGNKELIEAMIGKQHNRYNEGIVKAASINPRSDTANLLESLLNPDPEKRISVFAAMKHPFFNGVSQQVQRLFYGKTPALIENSNTCTKFRKLIREESTSMSLNCVAVLPGMTSLEKMRNYTFVVNRVFSFVLQTSGEGTEYLLTFSLGIYLLRCMLSSTIGGSYTVKELTKTALACISIASKYHYRRAISVKSISALIGEEDAEQISSLEKEIFSQVGGKIHLPTSYRILVELIGCPNNNNDPSLRLYAWSVGILVALEQTKAAFVGKPSELARLAVHIAAHYFMLDTASGKGSTICFSKYGIMPIRDIETGAKLAYSSLKLMHPASLSDLVNDIAFIIEVIDKREGIQFALEKLTSNRFLEIMKGELHTEYAPPDNEETESDEEVVLKKRSKLDDSIELELSDVEDDPRNILTSTVNTIYKGISNMFY